MIDLHMHSKHSVDGEKTTKQLVEMAKEKGLKIISLTDHDTMAGVKDFIKLCQENKIIGIPGIEITGQIDDNIVHILAYNYNIETTEFDKFLDIITKAEDDAASATVKLYIEKFKMDISYEELLDKAMKASFPFEGVFGELINNEKYHHYDILKPYLPGGERSDLPMVNFYWDNCTKGKEYYIYTAYADYTVVISAILKAGGTPVIAHPFNFFYENPEYIDKLVEAGVMGIEALSNYHDEDMNKHYLRVAKEKDLFITAGSDYHGAFKPLVKMGEYGYKNSDELLKPVLEKWGVSYGD